MVVGSPLHGRRRKQHLHNCERDSHSRGRAGDVQPARRRCDSQFLGTKSRRQKRSHSGKDQHNLDSGGQAGCLSRAVRRVLRPSAREDGAVGSRGAAGAVQRVATKPDAAGCGGDERRRRSAPARSSRGSVFHVDSGVIARDVGARQAFVLHVDTGSGAVYAQVRWQR